jgi:hypothetical protein
VPGIIAPVISGDRRGFQVNAPCPRLKSEDLISRKVTLENPLGS